MEQLNRIKDGCYCLGNNFNEYNDLVKKFIEKIYAQSLLYYGEKYVGINSTKTSNLDISKIEESLGYLEDYLYYFYINYNTDFYNIFLNLINKLSFITVLSPNERGLYGKYIPGEKCLYINPAMKSSIELDGNARIRLYINHELGHIINNDWMNSVVEYLNKSTIDKKFNKKLIYDGFSLLDESITQNRAEEITYYFLKKQRPKKTDKRSSLFNRTSYKTNYDYYGELQIPSINFSRTLRGIGRIADDDQAFNQLCDRALRKDFVFNIIEEYKVDGQLDNLYYLFEKLGIIKNASYAAFGMADKYYLRESLDALNKYNSLVVKLRDFRAPFPKNHK